MNEIEMMKKAIEIIGSKGQVARELGYDGGGRAYHITRVLEGTWSLPPHKLRKLKELLKSKECMHACKL